MRQHPGNTTTPTGTWVSLLILFPLFHKDIPSFTRLVTKDAFRCYAFLGLLSTGEAQASSTSGIPTDCNLRPS